MALLGRTRWAIAEGYIPAWGNGREPEFTSHETACILNASDRDAHVHVPARRTKHIRFNDLKEPAEIPKATNYSSVIESDVPIVVQHTRLDSRQSENALLSTIAFALD